MKKEIFENVAKARQSLMSAGTIEEQAPANAQVTSAQGRLLAISEAYPDLKANASFVRLQDELAGTENRIVGATPQNNYKMSTENYSIEVQSERPESDYLILRLVSSGADSTRNVWVQKDGNLWYVINNVATYSSIRPPVVKSNSMMRIMINASYLKP